MAMQVVCCVCQRCKVYNGWHRGLIAGNSELSHGYCPECFRQAMLRFGLAQDSDDALCEERGFGSRAHRGTDMVMMSAKGE